MGVAETGLPAVTRSAVATFDPLRTRRIIARGLEELARPRTILHVDGHAFIQKVLRAKMAEFLVEARAALVCRASAEEALSFLRDHRVDLIVSSSLAECEVHAGRSEGSAFLRRCKHLFPCTPFLFFTTPGRDEADFSQADAVVHKSSNFSELLAAIRRLLPARPDR